jgi:hypothetical protein
MMTAKVIYERHETNHILGSIAAYCGRYILTFQSNLLPQTGQTNTPCTENTMQMQVQGGPVKMWPVEHCSVEK